MGYLEYESPSVTTDVAVFSIIEKDTLNYRKLKEKKLHLLLIKRGREPFVGKWGLPGGFLQPDETVDECARRELMEETNVQEVHINQLRVFSDLKRDPRGRVITSAHYALVDGRKLNLSPDDDTVDVEWFSIDFIFIRKETDVQENKVCHKTYYSLVLKARDMEFKSIVIEKKTISNYDVIEDFEIIENDLAFDHATIISYAILYLRNNLWRQNLAFELLPDLFTLTDLQKVFEAVLDTSLITANFRRKIKDLVIPTSEVEKGGHRPSILFRQNLLGEKERDQKKW